MDHKSGATAKVELLDRGTEHTETKIFDRNDTSSETARCHTISVVDFEKNGSEVQFWAKRKSAKVTKDDLEAVQVEQAAESLH